jgi:hypothetical protein
MFGYFWIWTCFTCTTASILTMLVCAGYSFLFIDGTILPVHFSESLLDPCNMACCTCVNHIQPYLSFAVLNHEILYIGIISVPNASVAGGMEQVLSLLHCRGVHALSFRFCIRSGITTSTGLLVFRSPLSWLYEQHLKILSAFDIQSDPIFISRTSKYTRS